MIVTWDDLKNILVKDFDLALYKLREEARENDEELIFVCPSDLYNSRPGRISTRLLHICDKYITHELKEAEFSSFKIIKDRNPDRKIDDELLVHFGLV